MSSRRSISRLLALTVSLSPLAIGLAPSSSASAATSSSAPSAAAASTDPQGTASILGVVRDHSGHPIDGVEVEAVPAATPTAEPVSSALTYEMPGLSEHGAFRLEVPAGSYVVRFSSTDDAEDPIQTATYGGGAGTVVTVADGDQEFLDDTTVFPTPQGAAAGQVLDADGDPLGDVPVQVARYYATGNDYTDYTIIGSDCTDDDGRYEVPGLVAGREYSVAVSRGAGECPEDSVVPDHLDHWLGGAPTGGTAQRFVAGTGATAVSALRLTRPVPVVTHVQAASDGYGDVTYYVVSPRGLEEVATDYGEGGFGLLPGSFHYTAGTFGSAPDGTYGETYLGNTPDPDSAATFVVTAPGPVDAGTIIAGSGSAGLSVRVVDATGDRISGATVIPWRHTASGDVRAPQAQEISPGRYGFTALAGAAYTFEVQVSGRTTYLGGSDLATATWVQAVAPGTDAGTVTVAVSPAKVRGRVVDNLGVPVADARVRLYGTLIGCTTCDGPVKIGVRPSTDEDGRFLIPITNGMRTKYSDFRVYVDNDAWHDAAWYGGTSLDDALVFSWPEAGKDLPLPQDLEQPWLAGTVSSTVSGLTADELQGDVQVVLYRWDGSDWATTKTMAVGDDGRYRRSGVAPGTYAVAVLPGYLAGGGFLTSYSGGGTTLPAGPEALGAFTVTAEHNPTVGPDVAIRRGVLVSGRVADAQGHPVAGASVSLTRWVRFDAGDGETHWQQDYDGMPSAGVRTGEDGRYELHADPASRVTVDVSRSGYASVTADLASPQFIDLPADGAVHDVLLSPAADVDAARTWCLANTAHAEDTITFAGTELKLGYGEILPSTAEAYYNSVLEQMGHDAGLVVVPDSPYEASWGVSEDGKTLCVRWGQTTWSATAYALLQASPAGGFDVTYRYVSVPNSGASPVGWDDGDGHQHVIPGFEDGGYADGGAHPLTEGHEGTDVAGEYAFHFDGFTPRAAGPKVAVRPTVPQVVYPGQSAIVSPGAWRLDGVVSPDVQLSYRWMTWPAVWTTAPTLPITPDMAGRWMSVEVHAWAPGHEETVRTLGFRVAAGPAAASNQTAPAIDHSTAQVGDELTASPGGWTPAEGLGGDELAYSYYWYARDAGETWDQYVGEGPTWTVTSEYADSDVFARVEVSAPGHEAVDADSASIHVGAAPALVATTLPAVTGTARVGSALTVTTGAWDAEDVHATVSWRIGSSSRSGQPTYTPQLKDAGKYLSVVVTASAPGRSEGTWTKTVGQVAAATEPTGPLTVHVARPNGEPGVGSWVEVCDRTTYGCVPGGRVEASGDLTVTVVRGVSYQVRAYAPTGYDDAEPVNYPMPVEGAGSTTITLRAASPAPPNATIGQGGTTVSDTPDTPVVYYGDPLDIAVTGCPTVDAPTYSVQFFDGSDPLTGTLTPGSVVGGLRSYTARVPAFYPRHGDAEIETNVPATCGSAPTRVRIYIDPSGVVVDQYGRSIDGATVTLLRSDTATGPFVAVPDGSDIMSTANRRNPTVTGPQGLFQWDVDAGWYKVQAEKAGCSTGASEAMEVPPPRLDLVVKLDCQVAAPAPTAALSGTPSVGNTLTTSAASWPAFYEATSVVWKRDGQVVGTGFTYPVTSLDQGHTLTVWQSSRRAAVAGDPGRQAPLSFAAVASQTGQVVVPAAPLVQTASSVKVKLKAKSIKKSQRATMTVTVKVGNRPATGSVVVYDGAKRLKVYSLAKAKKGVLTVKLPKLKKGRHALVVRYLGSATVAASAATVKLTVR